MNKIQTPQTIKKLGIYSSLHRVGKNRMQSSRHDQVNTKFKWLTNQGPLQQPTCKQPTENRLQYYQ